MINHSKAKKTIILQKAIQGVTVKSEDGWKLEDQFILHSSSKRQPPLSYWSLNIIGILVAIQMFAISKTEDARKDTTKSLATTH